MMGLIFRQGLHACDVGGQLVFLDVAADRYFALTGPPNALCHRLIRGNPPTSGDAAAIAELMRRGLLVEVGHMARPELCPAPPSIRHRLAGDDARIDPGLLGAALARYTIALVEGRVRQIDRILASVGRAKARLDVRERPTRTTADLAATFARADRILTAHDRCLPRSIALTRTMLAANMSPDLVIGVKLRPFAAHSWVQHGNALVSDDLATVRPYTPILVL